LAGGHRQYILAVNHDNKAGLFAIEKFFDNHTRTRFAKGVAGQHVTYRVFRLDQGHGDDNAFARSQAVSLDDNWRALFTKISQGGLDFSEVLIIGSRDLVASQEVLGERLRAFQLGSASGRTEAIQATAAE